MREKDVFFLGVYFDVPGAKFPTVGLYLVYNKEVEVKAVKFITKFGFLQFDLHSLPYPTINRLISVGSLHPLL